MSKYSMFDADWYLQNNPDVAAAGLDPYAHWIGHGIAEGRVPHGKITPTQWAQTSDHYGANYLNNNPDAAADIRQHYVDTGEVMTPGQHYQQFGEAQGLDYGLNPYSNSHTVQWVNPDGSNGHYMMPGYQDMLADVTSHHVDQGNITLQPGVNGTPTYQVTDNWSHNPNAPYVDPFQNPSNGTGGGAGAANGFQSQLDGLSNQFGTFQQSLDDRFNQFGQDLTNQFQQQFGQQTQAQQFDPNAFMSTMGDTFGNLMNGFNQQAQAQSQQNADLFTGILDTFRQQNQTNPASTDVNPANHAANNWQNAYNQSSVLPAQYNPNQNNAQNGFSPNWAQNNPFQIRTF